MNEKTDYGFGIKVTTHCEGAWSFGSCISHSFGDMFYIEEFDRVFVAEDTGPGVNGRHLDLFYEEYDDVISFPTGYYDVYSVWYEEVDYYPNGDVILNDIWEEI